MSGNDGKASRLFDDEDADGDPLWEEALREAFGPGADDPGSVISALEERSKISARVLLQERDDAKSPVINPLTADVAEGRRCGRYLLLGELARGGMGMVLQGRDVDLGRDVALKVLKSEYADSPHMVQRFIEEAQIGGQLQHPGIVPVYELGIDSEERPFFAMKLIRGRTLAALLSERKDTSEDRVRFLGIFEQVCQTLAYAHSRQVIHRDLKPANVMVGSFGEVQVVDWGFAKVLSRGGIADELLAMRESLGLSDEVETVRSGPEGSESLAGSVLGTPSYMPPEQARGNIDELDERADVFSLGAILLEILTGKPPYVKQPGSAVIQQAETASLADAFDRLSQAHAGEELTALARRCLESDPKDRPRDASVIAAAIGQFLVGTEQRAREAEVATAEARIRVSEARKRGRLTLALAGSALLTLSLCLVAWIWLRSKTDENDREIRDALTQSVALAAANDWDGAEDALRRAEIMAEQTRTSVTVANEVAWRRQAHDANVDDARNASDRLERETRIVARLADIAARPGEGLDWGDVEYASAFRDYGIDILNLTPTLASRRVLAERPEVASAIAFALDDWAIRRRLALMENWRPLLVTASLVDDDPWRNRLRNAVVSNDRADLLFIVKELVDPAKQQARGLELLAKGLESEDPDVALDVLRKAFRAHRGDFGINYALGRMTAELAARASGSASEELLSESHRHLLIATALRPLNRHVRVSYADLLSALGKHEEAFSVLSELLEADPQFVEAELGWIGVLIRRGDLDAAEEKAKQLAEADSEDYRPHVLLARVAKLRGDQGGYFRAMRREISIRQNRRRAPRTESLGAPAKLAELIAQRDREPDVVSHHLLLVESYLQRGELDAASAICFGALERYPEEPDVSRVLGDVRRAQGRYDDAAAAYRKAVELGNDPWQAERGLEIATRLRRASRELNEYLKTRELPDGVDPTIMAEVCLRAGYPATALKLYSKAASRRGPQGSPSDVLLALAQTAFGRGEDAAQVDDPARAVYRGQLRHLLSRRRGHETGGRPDWRRSGGFGSSRGSASRPRWIDDARLGFLKDLQIFPESERDSWSRILQSAESRGEIGERSESSKPKP